MDPRDITELRTLINRAENVVRQLGQLVPKDNTWLEWRQKTLEKRLAVIKADLHVIVERVQVMLIEKVVETKGAAK